MSGREAAYRAAALAAAEAEFTWMNCRKSRKPAAEAAWIEAAAACAAAEAAWIEESK